MPSKPSIEGVYIPNLVGLAASTVLNISCWHHVSERMDVQTERQMDDIMTIPLWPKFCKGVKIVFWVLVEQESQIQFFFPNLHLLKTNNYQIDTIYLPLICLLTILEDTFQNAYIQNWRFSLGCTFHSLMYTSSLLVWPFLPLLLSICLNFMLFFCFSSFCLFVKNIHWKMECVFDNLYYNKVWILRFTVL